MTYILYTISRERFGTFETMPTDINPQRKSRSNRSNRTMKQEMEAIRRELNFLKQQNCEASEDENASLNKLKTILRSGRSTLQKAARMLKA